MKSSERVIDLLSRKGLVRARDLPHELGLPPASIRPLLKTGEVVRVGRRLYSLKAANITEHYDLAETCQRVPNRVVCLVGTDDEGTVWRLKLA